MQRLSHRFLFYILVAFLVAASFDLRPVMLHQHVYDHVHEGFSFETSGHTSEIHHIGPASHDHHSHPISTINIDASQDTLAAASTLVQLAILSVFVLLLLPALLPVKGRTVPRTSFAPFRRRICAPPPLRAPPHPTCFA